MDRRQIQAPEQHPLPGDKLCIVFFCIGSDGRGKSTVHYKLCLVDLYPDDVIEGVRDDYNGVVYTPISPTLQIDTGSCVSIVRHAFCVLNQTLYVFEGFDGGAGAVETRHQKSIFTYDLQTLINNYDHSAKNRNPIIINLHEREEDSLNKVSEMLHKKVQPSAVLTPDGNKILVLDIELYHISDRIPGDVFELFDPVTLLSEHLPPIPDLPRPSAYNPYPRKLRVSSHGFVSMTRFACSLPQGTYVIDLEHEERSWEFVPGCVYHGGKLVFFVIEDRFLFTPWAVRDISSNEGKTTTTSFFHVPSSFNESKVPWYDECYHVYPGGDLTLLNHDKDKGECDFCVLNSEARMMDSDEDERVYSPYCNLSIDVCRAVYPKKGGEDEKKPVVVKLTSSRALRLSSEPDEYKIGVSVTMRRKEGLPDYLYLPDLP